MSGHCCPLQPVPCEPTDSSRRRCWTEPVLRRCLWSFCVYSQLSVGHFRVPAVLAQQLPHRGAAQLPAGLSRGPGKQPQPARAPCSSQSSVSAEQEILVGFMRVEGWTSMDRSLVGFCDLP